MKSILSVSVDTELIELFEMKCQQEGKRKSHLVSELLNSFLQTEHTADIEDMQELERQLSRKRIEMGRIEKELNKRKDSFKKEQEEMDRRASVVVTAKPGEYGVSKGE